MKLKGERNNLSPYETLGQKILGQSIVASNLYSGPFRRTTSVVSALCPGNLIVYDPTNTTSANALLDVSEWR
jgi:hypothetical protein